ncbi:MAG: cation:proton antiporter [Alphaproteobacteria bacterium]|nr:cation:proton antiporter [Alphaproteobacteria bacterium]
MSGDQVWEILAFLAAVVVLIPVFYRLKVNPMLAFIAAGIILGPHALKLIKDTGVTENIGEAGLLFLMFSIGLELSFHRFKALRKFIFGHGCAQMLATTIFIGGCSMFMHKSFNEAILIGLALSMSSTAVALKIVQDKGGIHSTIGRSSVGILLLQDLAVIPIMVLMPKMGELSSALSIDAFMESVTRAVGAIVLIVLVGMWIIKPLFKIVANTKNSEAFTSMIFLAFLATAWATQAAGLSISLGAFLAGMLIAETEFGHEVEAEIESFSGLLLGIFFLSIGMMIDLPYALTHIPQIILLTIGIMVTKIAIIYFLERAFGSERRSAFVVAVALSQAGEFGFVVFNFACQNYHIISQNTSTQLQCCVALSMSLTPFLCSYVFKKLDAKDEAETAKRDMTAGENYTQDSTAEGMKDHIIVVGYGMVGQAAARMLSRNDCKLFVIDTDVQHIEKAKKNNRPYLFGSAANEKILSFANLKDARAVLICINGLPTTIRILKAIREMNKEIPVFVRCLESSHWNELTKLGATGVVSPAQECGIRLAANTILLSGGNEERMKETASILRQENIVNQPLPTSSEV